MAVPADTDACPCGRCETAAQTAGVPAKRKPRPLAFGQCCAPLLRGEKQAQDAQALMRSRYNPSTCPPDLHLENDVQWLGLKIECYHPISLAKAEVVFVARYRSNGRTYRLHEHSRFVYEQGHWLYLDAVNQSQ